MLQVWLALALCAPGDAAEVRLDAELVLRDGQRHLDTAAGNARLVSTDAAIDADRIAYDEDRRVATAAGHVVARLAQAGLVLVVADVVTVRFDASNHVQEVYLADGQALSKTGVPRDAFLAAGTIAEARALGTTQAVLTGNHLRREGEGWAIEALELVPCDCDLEHPSWSIGSTRATVYPEAERVSVTNPVVKVKGVPVLWLPWLSLPLTDRQTGLLFPRPGYSPQLYGFALDEPVFITLGRSADLTVTPGFFTGGQRVDPRDPSARLPAGVAGPRLGVELRYTPSRRTTGRFNLGLLYDFHPLHDVADWSVQQAGTHRGLRGELSWQHAQDFDHGFGTRVELSGYSDGDYVRDLTVDVLASATTYTRSSATAFHRGADHALSLDVGLRQDLQWGYDLLGQRTLSTDAAAPRPQLGPWGPGTLQRLPALSFGWSPSLDGPARISLEAEAVRLAPLFSLTGDEGSAAAEGRVQAEPFSAGIARLFSVTPIGSGTGDRRWQSGEREARDRLMVLPKISLTATPGRLFTAKLELAWRQLAWAGEASGRLWARGYLLAGGSLETQLSRRFGAIRHVLQPRAEVRAVPFGFERSTDGSGLVPYDAVDAAVPDVSPRLQGVLELRQRLLSNAGDELLRVDLGQGLELASSASAAFGPRVGESWARVGSRVGWFSLQGQARFDPNRLTDGTLVGLTRVGGRLSIDDAKGHGAWVGYENLMLEGSARSRQPLDLLFQLERGYTSATRTDQLTFGARWNFGPARLRYDALVGRLPRLDGTPGTELAFQQHQVGVGVAPACDCWSVELTATQPLHPVIIPSFGLSVTVSRFGTIGLSR